MHLIKHHILMTIRHAKRSKGYALINIVGLVIALACAIFMSLYILDERSFDHFHTKSKRIYRVVNNNTAKVPPPLGTALKKAFPEIQNFASLRPSLLGWMIQYKDRTFYETQGYWANESLFQVFDFPLLKGNPATALTAPYSIVISQSMASRYFGTEDPMGKTFVVNDRWGELKITGVMRDIPSNSHIQAHFFISTTTLVQRERTRLNREALRWVRVLHHYIYITLPENYPVESIENKLPDFVQNETYVNPIVFIEQTLNLKLQPLTDIHLYSHLDSEISPNSNATLLYSLIAVTCFLLLIASANFVNLVTAHTTTRLREIGVKKTIGAHRHQLIGQFLTESLVTIFIAFLVALLIIICLLPAYQNLTDKNPFVIWSQWPLEITVGLFTLTLSLGLLSGAYPALFLSAFKPHETLKGLLNSNVFGNHLRSLLVTAQFAITITLAICSYTVYNQWTYLRNKPLGFDKDQVVVIKQRGRMRSRNGYTVFKNELLQNPNIINMTSSDFLPGIEGDIESISAHRPGSEKQYLSCFDTGREAIDAMGLELLAGRALSSEQAMNKKSQALIINETTMKNFGWASPSDAIDQVLISDEWGGEGYVMGVVKDFNFKSLHQSVEPLVMTPDGRGFIAIRFHPHQTDEVVQAIEQTWKEHFPKYPLEYTFMKDKWNHLYAAEEKLGKILGIFSALSIGIACLGLLGLVAFITERRMKEIGIRKVLGASISNLFGLIAKDFVKLVIIANIIVCPIAYYVVEHWLQNFAYRIEIGITPFLLVSLLTLLIAIATVSYQSLKAAKTNPVDVLRSE